MDPTETNALDTMQQKLTEARLCVGQAKSLRPAEPKLARQAARIRQLEADLATALVENGNAARDAARAEREACARLVDSLAGRVPELVELDALRHAATAIRTRRS
jgi:hypothetical protein